MDWEDAMDEARKELGYSKDEYVEDWDRLVDEAHDILEYNREEEYQEFCIEAHYKYKDYLKSDRWKSLRKEILNRDNFKCRDCGCRAEAVHHLTYEFLETPYEKEHCISICNNCHGRRHNIIPKIEKIEPKINIHTKKHCPNCKKELIIQINIHGKAYYCPDYHKCGYLIKFKLEDYKQFEDIEE